MTIYKNTTVNFSNIQEDILPALDNIVSLGKAGNRFKGAHLGQGTLYLTDTTTNNDAAISVDNGVFKIDGIVQAQLQNIKITNLTFNDNTLQTTAAIAQVNSDWNATTGKAQILNKPTIPAAQVNSDWNSSSGASQILNKPDIVVPTVTTYVSTLSSTNLAYSGTPTSARYIATGKMVYATIDVSLASVTNFGQNGIQYFLTLPIAAAYSSFFHGTCTIAGIIYGIGGQITAGSNSIALFYDDSHGTGTPNTWEFMTKQKPVNLTTSTTFNISGTYISQ